MTSVPKFEEAVRNFIVGVVAMTYQLVDKADLEAMLNLKDLSAVIFSLSPSLPLSLFPSFSRTHTRINICATYFHVDHASRLTHIDEHHNVTLF